jgi:hypothetical protein
MYIYILQINWGFKKIMEGGAEVEPSPLLLRPLLAYLYQPQMMMDDDECGAVDGIIGRGNRTT